MNDIMEECCGSDGRLDYELLRQFMERCSTQDFSEAQLAMMKDFCSHENLPDLEKLKEFMELCDCNPE